MMPSSNCNARFTHWMLKSLYAAPAPHECPIGWQAVVSVHALLSVIQCGMLFATSGHRAKGFSMAFHTGQSYCQHAICIGTPEVQKLLLAPKARDVEDAVSFYLHA